MIIAFFKLFHLHLLVHRNIIILGTWTTEIEIITAVLLLQTIIYVYGPCGKINKCQKHAIHTCETEADIHYNECIYFTNICSHFETVKRM